MPLTRRQTLAAGATALGASALAPAGALARRPALFELVLEDGTASAAAASGWRTLAPRRAPRRFDLLGLRWSAGASPEAQVRVRRARGSWSRWLPLHALGDHAPDRSRRDADARRDPVGTEPAWTGTADVFQLRLRGRAPGLRVRFVRAKPTATVARAVTARLARQAEAQPAPAGTTQPPPVVTRTQWGADSVPPREDPDYGEVQLAFVHHTVSTNDYGPEDSAAIVLGIARYHRDSLKWNDIGYNFLVDKYGQVFEGRAGGMELAVVGAQAQGFNSVSTGIACLGDFRGIAQTQPGLDALAQIVAWKLAVHGVPPEGPVTVRSAGGSTNRHRSGTAVTFERISGHRDSNETTCPGDALYGQLPALRAAVARRTGSPPAPAPAPAPAAAAEPAAAPKPARAPARLTLALSGRRVRRGRAVRVTGTLTPAPAGGRILCVFERQVGARWVVVQRKRINVRRGTYATSVRPRLAGAYRVTVSTPGARRQLRLRASTAAGATGGAASG